MSEPLSRLQPPSSGGDTAEEKAWPAPTAASTGEKLEWSIIDLNLATSIGMEVFLPGLWRRMHEDGTFPMFFHEGPEMNFLQFGALIASLSSDRRVQLIVGSDKDGNMREHAGLVILEHIFVHEKVKRAVGNFLFFHEYWHRHDSLELGYAVMNHWFLTMGFDVIGGLTPRANRAALQFIKRLGFQIVGDIPNFTIYDGKPSASATSFLTKEMWMAKKASADGR